LIKIPSQYLDGIPHNVTSLIGRMKRCFLV